MTPYDYTPNNNYSGAPPQQLPPQQPQYSPYPQYNPYNSYAPYQPPQTEMQQQMMQQLQIQRARSKEKSQIFTAGLAIGGALIGGIIIEIILMVIMQAIGLMDAFNSSFVVQHATNIIVVDLFGLVLPFGAIALMMKNRFVTPIVPHKKFGFANGVLWVFFGLGIAMLANFITNGVISLFDMMGYELSQPEMLDPKTPFDCVMLAISTAIAPAVCEEFAMRCSAFGILRRHGKAFAVVAVSIVFGLMHGNVIQFVFAFFVGLALAYVTLATGSIVPAMIVHGMNNGLSVVQDIVSLAVNSKTGETVSDVLLLTFLALGVISAICLAVKKKLIVKDPEQAQKPYRIGFGTKLALLIPGLFLPFVVLIVYTMQYIQPK